MPLPDFTSPTTFPPFTSLPLTTTPSSENQEEHYLLAQIHQNMTLTKPTLICTDHTNTSFAVVFGSRPASGPDTLDLSRLGYRRGATLVLPGARRTPPKEGDGSQGFECQTKGWNEGGHKADCKVIKAIRAIWP
ncbi:hypothetical protein B0I37DRAFT_418736 [Chaetomium sp. MPI-CAGE-AT-0009]|nr:hypothetical protein B0I37DRAFT_418736 [Chaetomium sp. MPI-CAGE-AT-0009]